MVIERETAFQLGLAGGAVIAFILAAAFVGSAFQANGNLSPLGGQFLVAVIGGFVLLMVIAGLYLERQQF